MRSMRIALVAVMTVVWIFSLRLVVTAQEGPKFFDTETWVLHRGPIYKFEKNDYVDAQWKACGDYFRSATAFATEWSTGPDQYSVVLHKREVSADGKVIRPSDVIGSAVRERIQVIFVEGDSVPRVEIKRTLGGGNPTYYVSMSRAEYRKAPCLKVVEVASR
jgi:hypothetical protein